MEKDNFISIKKTKKMTVAKFEIEQSKVNKGSRILVAITETGEKFVVGGNPHYPPDLIPYDKCWDALGEENYKKLTGR